MSKDKQIVIKKDLPDLRSDEGKFIRILDDGKKLNVIRPDRQDPVDKVISLRKRIRYYKWNPFARWNRKVDEWTAFESIENQKMIHAERWSAIGHGYRVLFSRIREMFAPTKPRYGSFQEMCRDQDISETDIKKLISVRKMQIAVFYLFMLLPLVSACYFIYHKMVWMFVMNVWMLLMLGGVNLLFIIELWRLQHRRLGGFKQWFRS